MEWHFLILFQVGNTVFFFFFFKQNRYLMENTQIIKVTTIGALNIDGKGLILGYSI